MNSMYAECIKIYTSSLEESFEKISSDVEIDQDFKDIEIGRFCDIAMRAALNKVTLIIFLKKLHGI